MVACEVLCRLRVQSLNRETLQASLDRPVEMSAQGQATLGDLIQLSSNDRIAYELRPELDGVTFKDRPVTTNTYGFRSAELPHEAGPDTVTIVGIGDSVMFGHGVGDGECYLDQLQRLLTVLGHDQLHPSPAMFSPVVSSRSHRRFIHWMAPPAAPLTRLSITENTTADRPDAATPM